jgi:hypothetical protein
MPKHVKPAPAVVPPPARPIPWLWLGLAIAAGGLLGWAVGNGGFTRAPAHATAPAASVLPAAAKPPAPAAPGLTAAQSNAIFQMTNRAAVLPATNAAPPPLLTAQARPPVAPVIPTAAPTGETLYNGIVLPAVWPPKNEYRPGEPMAVPYLSNPPPVIDITTGRQLFVDDFLIESNTLQRAWHQPVPHSNNPVLKPDREWEKAGGAMAMPFSDGVWLDPMNWITAPEFKPEEVQDVFRLAALLQPGTNALATWFAAQISPAAQAKLKDFRSTNLTEIAAMQALLAGELNRVIAGASIFEAARFQGVQLSARAGALLAQNPQGDRLKRLNRWLLEDAFPRELFKMQPVFTCHYMAGYGRGTALAISTNGLDWEKPNFDVRPGSNLVQADPRDSSTVWLDQSEPDPQRRYKMWRSHKDGDTFGLSLHFSPDGIHWGPRVLRTGSSGDRTTVFWNPFRKVWVYSLRHGWGVPRARRYWEVKDLLAGPHWQAIGEPPMWVGADRLDPMRADLQEAPQLYNLDAVAYESLMVGLFTIWRGDKNIPEGRPKPNSVWLGFSRDGYHWDRPVRQPFLDVSETKGDWNWGNVQSVAGGFHVVGRNLHFYFSGRAGLPGQRDGGGAMGLATLRRDGFCSMDAGPQGGTLTTRPVKFNARFMFVNLKTNAPDGELRIEILHADGRPITLTKNDTKENLVPFTPDKAVPATGDQTLMGVSWQNGIQDLSMLADKPVRIRFHLKNASLYSFWVGPGMLGRSLGPVAAGGPNFTGPNDNVGNASYRPFPAVPRTIPVPPPLPAPAPAPATTPVPPKK